MTKKTLAVLDFEAGEGLEHDAGIVSEEVRISFFRTKSYKVVERTRMNQLMREQSIRQSGLTDENTVSEVGKMLNVNLIVIGKVTRLGDEWFISARALDVNSGEMVLGESSSAKGQADLVRASRDLVDRMVGKKKFRNWEDDMDRRIEALGDHINRSIDKGLKELDRKLQKH